MDLFGIGIAEVIFVLLIALLLLGPNDMIKTGKTIGRFLRRLVTSPNWRVLQETSRELRNLPNTLMREAGIDEIEQTLKEEFKEINEMSPEKEMSSLKSEMERVQRDITSWTTPPPPRTVPPPTQSRPEPVILPDKDTQANPPPKNDKPTAAG
jgi:Sec-independent protein translocase protein TatA